MSYIVRCIWPPTGEAIRTLWSVLFQELDIIILSKCEGTPFPHPVSFPHFPWWRHRYLLAMTLSLATGLHLPNTLKANLFHRGFMITYWELTNKKPGCLDFPVTGFVAKITRDWLAIIYWLNPVHSLEISIWSFKISRFPLGSWLRIAAMCSPSQLISWSHNNNC